MVTTVVREGDRLLGVTNDPSGGYSQCSHSRLTDWRADHRLRGRPPVHLRSLLVTAGGTPVGVIEFPLTSGRAPAADVQRALDTQLGELPDPPPPPAAHDPITVVVATRHRPRSLERCLRALLAGDHPDVTVLVVDNDPADERTMKVVSGLRDRRVRYVYEQRRGASVGRNRGLAEVTTGLVAFTDDDTEPDRVHPTGIERLRLGG